MVGKSKIYIRTYQLKNQSNFLGPKIPKFFRWGSVKRGQDFKGMF